MAKRKNQTRSAGKQLEQAQDPQRLIVQKAYELYEQSGRIEGRDLENWLEAERLVRAEFQTQG